MTKPVVDNNLEVILRAYPKGVAVEALKEQFSGSGDEFSSQAQTLWVDGKLTGIAKEGCCENICMEYCISYMRDGREWKLSKF